MDTQTQELDGDPSPKTNSLLVTVMGLSNGITVKWKPLSPITRVSQDICVLITIVMVPGQVLEQKLMKYNYSIQKHEK